MINTLIGTKQRMSVRFDSFGQRIPVTEIFAEPNIIAAKKDTKVVLGFGKKKKIKKTENALVNVLGFAPRVTKEVEISGNNQPGVADEVTVAIFESGDKVKITGTTQGKGFAGGVKRWGFAGGPKTHGQSDRHRAPGSIGQTTTPGRVYKGKKMAGHMGASKLTVTGLTVVEVDEAHNLLLVKGAVPGTRNGLVIVEKTGKAATNARHKSDQEENTEKSD